jgi:hypothetical protein
MPSTTVRETALEQNSHSCLLLINEPFDCKIVFERMFDYNVGMETHENHPAITWEHDARQPQLSAINKLRMAAMAGHMQLDKLAARRAALIDLLADGCPHPREEIWETIAAQLGEDCWGKVPQEALARDLAALRRGGIRIAYARRPEIRGYYLQYPVLKHPPSTQFDETNWQLIQAMRKLSVPEKNKRAFSASAFALRQKRLILAEEHPDWSDAQIDKIARQLVYGIQQEV